MTQFVVVCDRYVGEPLTFLVEAPHSEAAYDKLHESMPLHLRVQVKEIHVVSRRALDFRQVG